MSEFDDLFTKNEDEFSDFLKWLRPGQKIGLSGVLRYHEGSDPRDWADPGGAKYLPKEWQMLCGSIAWTGSAADHGAVEVTFPAAFSGTPIVLVTPINTTPLYKDIRCQAPLTSAAAMEIWWFSANNLTAATFTWLAIGPIGL
jgi:hypothetical protein